MADDFVMSSRKMHTGHYGARTLEGDLRRFNRLARVLSEKVLKMFDRAIAPGFEVVIYSLKSSKKRKDR